MATQGFAAQVTLDDNSAFLLIEFWVHVSKEVRTRPRWKRLREGFFNR
jgi:hypothetical protein